MSEVDLDEGDDILAEVYADKDRSFERKSGYVAILNDSPHPHASTTFGLLNTNLELNSKNDQ
jgi:hypothetical protein